MQDSSLRCPSCAATTSAARSNCQWCGSPLPGMVAARTAPIAADDPRLLPRELAPMPRRTGSATRFLFLLLVLGGMLTLLMVFFTVRQPVMDAPPPQPPDQSTPVEREPLPKSR